ncbi:hypothetical protein Peur_011208 [Populus x canadensis]
MITNPNNSFAKTICYEDLKPIIEDLQSISICGHQWFEYCSSEKKCSCPVCKQNCSAQDGGRLYSHSAGDQTEPLGDRKPGDEEDSELLRGEVERLEGIFLVLNTILERQVKEIKQLNEELYLCKDELKRQVKSMIDSMEQKASILHLIRLKSEELDALKLESIRLHDRNVALTKELVALKLVSDVNLEEDEVLKPASFGIEANNKDTVDIIRKSVVILIRARLVLVKDSRRQKINKLKTRVQELKIVVEVKDNETLRALKAPKKTKCKGIVTEGIKDNSNALSTSVSSIDQEVTASHDDIREVWPILNIRKDSLSPAPLSRPVNLLSVPFEFDVTGFKEWLEPNFVV